MGLYSSEEVEIQGKKRQIIYLDNSLQQIFDTKEDGFVEKHNDYIDYLRNLGHRSKKERIKQC